MRTLVKHSLKLALLSAVLAVVHSGTLLVDLTGYVPGHYVTIPFGYAYLSCMCK